MNPGSRLRDIAQIVAMSPIILAGVAVLLIIYIPAVLFFGVPALGAMAALVLVVTRYPLQCALVAGIAVFLRHLARSQARRRGQRAACEYLSVTLLRMRHHRLPPPPRAQLLDWLATIRADDSPPRYSGVSFDCERIWAHGPFMDGYRTVIDVVAQDIDADAAWSRSGSFATDLERLVIFLSINGDWRPASTAPPAPENASARTTFCIEQYIADLLDERDEIDFEENDDDAGHLVSTGCIFCGRSATISSS